MIENLNKIHHNSLELGHIFTAFTRKTLAAAGILLFDLPYNRKKLFHARHGAFRVCLRTATNSLSAPAAICASAT